MKSTQGKFSARLLVGVLVIALMLVASLLMSYSGALAQAEDPEFTSEFRLEDCKFKARGVNPYFILKPGYQLVYEGEEDGETINLVITVLNKTKNISLPDIGNVKTRVVEERETVNGEPAETSLNYFAICEQTNDVFYFGEDVDIFNEDGTVSHEGAWLAGQPDEDGLAEPGLIMPGTFLLGSRYFQEIAEGIALDRAEHTEMGLEITTPAGSFEQCVHIEETTPLEPGTVSDKFYCPGVGLVIDNVVELVDYGSKNQGNEENNGDNGSNENNDN